MTGMRLFYHPLKTVSDPLDTSRARLETSFNYPVGDRSGMMLYSNNSGDNAMNRNELTAMRDQILQAAAKRGVKRIRLCGSMARGDAGPDSDVDFLVEFEPGRSLLDHGGLLMDLQELLGCDVHIISEGSLKPRYRERVLGEAAPL